MKSGRPSRLYWANIWVSQGTSCEASPKLPRTNSSLNTTLSGNSATRSVTDRAGKRRTCRRIISAFQAAGRRKDPVEEGVWIGWTTGNVNVHRDHRIHTAAGSVILPKNARAATAGAHCDDESRLG